MKITMRKGRPTKRAIREIAETHGLIIQHLDAYDYAGFVRFGFRPEANERAVAVLGHLTAAGVPATLRLACRITGTAGCLHIEAIERRGKK